MEKANPPTASPRALTPDSRKKVFFAGRWLAGLCILFYLAFTLDFESVLGTIRGASVPWLVTGLGTLFLIRFLSGYQLATALRHHEGISVTTVRAFLVSAIASFYSLFLPGQLAAGAVKWYKLSRETGKKAEVFATVLFIRLLNTALILALGAIAASTEHSLGLRHLSGIGLGLALAIVIGLYVATTEMAQIKLAAILRAKLLKGMGFLHRPLMKVSLAFQQYRFLSRGQIGRIVAVPMVTTFLGAVEFYCAAKSLGLWIPFLSLLWLVALVYLLSLIPATVSGLGLREGALVFLLPMYGIDPAKALAFSLILFGFFLAFSLFGGMVESRESLLSAN